MVDTSADGRGACIPAHFPDKRVSGDTSSPLTSLQRSSNVLFVNARNPLVAKINFNLTCDFIMLPTTGRIHALAILNSVLGFSSLFTSLTLFFFYPLIGLARSGIILDTSLLFSLVFSLSLGVLFSLGSRGLCHALTSLCRLLTAQGFMLRFDVVYILP